MKQFLLTAVLFLVAAQLLDANAVSRNASQRRKHPVFENKMLCDACAYMIKNSIKKLQPTNLTADQVEKILMDGCKDYPGEGGQTICEVIAYEYDDNMYASLLAGQPSDPDTLCFMALVCIDRV